MNTFPCPHCSYQIIDDGTLSGQVVACPQCHGAMLMPGGKPPAPPQRPARPRNTNNALLIGAGVAVAGLLFLAAVTAILFSGPSSPLAVESDPSREAVRQHVLKWARHPATVRFIEWGPSDKREDGTVWVGVSWRDAGTVHHGMAHVSGGKVLLTTPFNWQHAHGYGENPSLEDQMQGLIDGFEKRSK